MLFYHMLFYHLDNSQTLFTLRTGLWRFMDYCDEDFATFGTNRAALMARFNANIKCPCLAPPRQGPPCAACCHENKLFIRAAQALHGTAAETTEDVTMSAVDTNTLPVTSASASRAAGAVYTARPAAVASAVVTALGASAAESTPTAAAAAAAAAAVSSCQFAAVVAAGLDDDARADERASLSAAATSTKLGITTAVFTVPVPAGAEAALRSTPFERAIFALTLRKPPNLADIYGALRTLCSNPLKEPGNDKVTGNFRARGINLK